MNEKNITVKLDPSLWICCDAFDSEINSEEEDFYQTISIGRSLYKAHKKKADESIAARDSENCTNEELRKHLRGKGITDEQELNFIFKALYQRENAVNDFFCYMYIVACNYFGLPQVRNTDGSKIENEICIKQYDQATGEAIFDIKQQARIHNVPNNQEIKIPGYSLNFHINLKDKTYCFSNFVIERSGKTMKEKQLKTLEVFKEKDNSYLIQTPAAKEIKRCLVAIKETSSELKNESEELAQSVKRAMAVLPTSLTPQEKIPQVQLMKAIEKIKPQVQGEINKSFLVFMIISSLLIVPALVLALVNWVCRGEILVYNRNKAQENLHNIIQHQAMLSSTLKLC